MYTLHWYGVLTSMDGPHKNGLLVPTNSGRITPAVGKYDFLNGLLQCL